MSAPAAARALSLALGPPDAASLAALGPLAAALADDPPDGVPAAALRALAGAVPDAARPGAVDDAAAAYEEVFGRTVRLAPCEGSHERDPFRQARRMADVAAFYRAFGAGADGPLRERPDHVGCELEFLAFLGLARAEAEADGRAADAEVCRAAEDRFLEEHVAAWVPALCRAIPPLTDSPMLVAAAAVGERYVDAEVRARGLRPRPLGLRGERGELEQDALTCGECPAAAGRGGP
jgi:putative dimethyl sulfoxide reductase chaperone